MLPLARRVCLVATIALAGSASAEGPGPRYDVVVVPGCPSDDGGRLSRCQESRILWAAILWERGEAAHFITSGAAVHSPYVEAEALAQGMVALGVPADRIYLERDALHTDENMYNSARIARALGFRSIAVASNGGHAVWGCRMMLDWGQPCTALPVDLPAIEARAAGHEALLAGIRTRRVPDAEWVTLDERERARARATGRHRPPSFLLYPMLAVMRVTGQPWIPIAPARTPRITWAMLQSQPQAPSPQSPSPRSPSSPQSPSPPPPRSARAPK